MQDRYAEWTDRDAVDRRIPSVDCHDLDYEDWCYCLQGKPFTGFKATRYSDGKLESLVGLTDGIEHGLPVVWHPTGTLHLFAGTAESVYHGWVIEWDQDGKLLKAEQYDSGLLVANDSRSEADERRLRSRVSW